MAIHTFFIPTCCLSILRSLCWRTAVFAPCRLQNKFATVPVPSSRASLSDRTAIGNGNIFIALVRMLWPIQMLLFSYDYRTRAIAHALRTHRWQKCSNDSTFRILREHRLLMFFCFSPMTACRSLLSMIPLCRSPPAPLVRVCGPCGTIATERSSFSVQCLAIRIQDNAGCTAMQLCLHWKTSGY